MITTLIMAMIDDDPVHLTHGHGYTPYGHDGGSAGPTGLVNTTMSAARAIGVNIRTAAPSATEPTVATAFMITIMGITATVTKPNATRADRRHLWSLGAR